MATQIRSEKCEVPKKSVKAACRPARPEDSPCERCQPFPVSGPLFDNLNKTHQQLRAAIGGASGGASGRVRSYKMTSVRLADGKFRQAGCGPNFQGGRLTLCTCMHPLRAEREAEEWRGWWIAGLTNQCGCVWVFYLAEVGCAYESQRDLWNAMSSETREAKSTRYDVHGDLYEPQPLQESDPFDPANYFSPMIGHRHRFRQDDDTWRRDIDFFHANFKRHSAYLLASPRRTFIWEQPILYVAGTHSRTDSWTSVNHFLSILKNA